jgi:hypothetical protein
MPDKIKIKGRKIVVKINREGHEYKGVARCHPNDVFDGVIGTELALARAELKYKEEKLEVVEAILRPIQKKIFELRKEIRETQKFGEKFESMRDKIVMDLNLLNDYDHKMSSLND